MDTMLHNPGSDLRAVLQRGPGAGLCRGRSRRRTSTADDIRRKLTISANIAFDSAAFGKRTSPTFGIRNVCDADIAAFSSKNLVCKLIATGTKTAAGVAAYVEPTLVAATEPESAVPSNFNLITFEGENVGRLSFFGQGAGRFPTAV